jgi:hypothetical protein
MDYGMIGKIEKAKFYSEERERIRFDSFQVAFQGDNHSHVVGYDQATWTCDCVFFASRSVCSHTMALERVLQDMVELG